tara:strand:+ start:1093 stop:1263 length:171 start_codon:yes stop_codon:yes gene_type:complete
MNGAEVISITDLWDDNKLSSEVLERRRQMRAFINKEAQQDNAIVELKPDPGDIKDD